MALDVKPILAALSKAIVSLRRADGSKHEADDTTHTDALLAAIGKLSDFYLGIDIQGKIYDLSTTSPYADESIDVLGTVPAFVRPLVDFLRDAGQTLRQAINSGDWAATTTVGDELPDFLERVALYQKILGEEEAKGPTTPSERLYRYVSAPLLQGRYPSDLDYPGIVPQVDPSQHKVPDVATIPILTYQVALFNSLTSPVSRLMSKLDHPITLMQQGIESAIKDLWGKAADTASRGFRGLLWVAAGLGVLWAGWRIYKAAKATDEARELEDDDPDDRPSLTAAERRAQDSYYEAKWRANREGLRAPSPADFDLPDEEDD